MNASKNEMSFLVFNLVDDVVFLHLEISFQITAPYIILLRLVMLFDFILQIAIWIFIFYIVEK